MKYEKIYENIDISVDKSVSDISIHLKPHCLTKVKFNKTFVSAAIFKCKFCFQTLRQ